MKTTNLSTCRHFRAKRMYVPDLVVGAVNSPEASRPTCHCWCTQTMIQLGPDERHVTEAGCADPGRTCYRTVRHV